MRFPLHLGRLEWLWFKIILIWLLTPVDYNVTDWVGSATVLPVSKWEITVFCRTRLFGLSITWSRKPCVAMSQKIGRWKHTTTRTCKWCLSRQLACSLPFMFSLNNNAGVLNSSCWTVWHLQEIAWSWLWRFCIWLVFVFDAWTFLLNVSVERFNDDKKLFVCKVNANSVHPDNHRTTDGTVKKATLRTDVCDVEYSVPSG
jgi:hypothetical protein